MEMLILVVCAVVSSTLLLVSGIAIGYLIGKGRTKTTEAVAERKTSQKASKDLERLAMLAIYYAFENAPKEVTWRKMLDAGEGEGGSWTYSADNAPMPITQVIFYMGSEGLAGPVGVHVFGGDNYHDLKKYGVYTEADLLDQR